MLHVICPEDRKPVIFAEAGEAHQSGMTNEDADRDEPEETRDTRELRRLRREHARLEKSVARATWLSAFCAGLSVFATLLLLYFSYRQERATLEATLFGKQIELAGDFFLRVEQIEDMLDRFTKDEKTKDRKE